MTAPAWMPLYVADYLADTGHLSALEHGVYLLLIMHYWQNGGLPTEDPKLARIARLAPREWQKIKPTMVDLFDDNWRHDRIDAELTKASETISKRIAAGVAGASARYGKGNGKGIANAGQSHRPSPSPSPTSTGSNEPSEGVAPAAPLSVDQEKQLFDRGKAVLGKTSGGLISKLLKAKGGSVPLARAAIEQASTKQNPAEYIGAVIANRARDGPNQTVDPRL